MKKRSLFTFFLLLVIVSGCGTLYVTGHYLLEMNRVIQQKFDGKKWKLPAIVYARSLELYPAKQLDPDMLEKELQLADYREEAPVTAPGGYYRDKGTFGIYTRGFHFASGYEEPVAMYLTIENGVVAQIRSGETSENIDFVRLDPARIGSFHPQVHEDRLVLKSGDIPELLQKGLIAVEDKAFRFHHGVSPAAIARAMVANVQSGKTVQGGSTLTQQLVKNLYLDRERSLKRKINEAVMALMLEYHYSKDDILTAYINEVFLGQDGGRAIHGFGLAAQFYFKKTLSDLSVAQTAALIGMVKGASYYDPRRFPERCKARRDVVLQVFRDDNIISEPLYRHALSEPLGGDQEQKNGFNRFPAYLDLVRFQLSGEYLTEDLQTDGLHILTSLDPQIQWRLEEQLKQSVDELEAQKGTVGVEGAAIITSRDNGEVLGLVGGRDYAASQFNRALDAERPVGSLIKPAVYLTGLAQGYTLATPLLDSGDGLEEYTADWKPKNYDKKEHGYVPLYYALAKSYNLATVHLGLNVGLKKVIATIKKLGFKKPITPYPSLLLGAVEMSPLQVLQLYQTIGSGGFYQPLRSIQSVTTKEGELLTRYGLEVEQRFPPALITLLTHALTRVVTEGTGRSYPFNPQRFYAGKTGTSDGLRDSWFAGFTDRYTGVVWLGRDDNQPTPFTGSSGALQVWGNVMESLGGGAREQNSSSEIVWKRVDLGSVFANTYDGPVVTTLPFIRWTEPKEARGSSQVDFQSIEKGARDLMKSINSLFQ